MADNVSMSEWPEHERKEWNVHRNIAGWALLMFCINRLFSRIDEWGLPQRAVYMVEIAVALAFFITIIAGTSLATIGSGTRFHGWWTERVHYLPAS